MFNGFTDSMKSFGHRANEMFDSTPKEAGDAMGEKAGEYKKYTETQVHKTADAYNGASMSCQEWAGGLKDDVVDGALDLKKIAGNAKDGVSSSIGYTFEHMNQSRHNAADYLRDTKDEGIEEVNEMRSEFSDAFSEGYKKGQHLND